MALAVLTFVVFGLWRQAEGARGTADSARDEAERQKGIAETALQGEERAKQQAERERERLARFEYGRTIQIAYQAWRDSKIAQARILLAGTRSELRGWEYDYVHRLCNDESAVLSGHRMNVRAAAFSPDGRLAATGSEDGTARLWDVATGRTTAVLDGKGPILFVRFSHDGTKVVAAGQTDAARVWEVATGRLLAELPSPNWVLQAAFSTDGERLTTLNYSHGRVWDVKTGRPVREFERFVAGRLASGWLYRWWLSRDGELLATDQGDSVVRVWDAAGKLLGELKGHTDTVVSAEFTPDRTRLVTAGRDQTVRVWEVATGRSVALLTDPHRSIGQVSVSRDGKRVVVAGRDTAARVWDVASGRVVAELKGHTNQVEQAEFDATGTRAISGGDDTARVWDLDGAKASYPLAVPNAVRQSVAAVSGDGTRVLMHEFGRGCHLCELPSGRRLAQMPWESPWQFYASLDDSGSLAVVPGKGFTAEVREPLRDERVVVSVRGEGVLSRDGRHLAVVDRVRHAMSVTDLATRDRVALQLAGVDNVLAVTNRGRLRVLAVGQHGRPAQVWDVATGRLLMEFHGHTDRIDTAAFNSDGSRVVTAGRGLDDTVRVWDAAFGAELLALPGNSVAVLTTDGTRLLARGAREGLLVYDARPRARATAGAAR